MSARRIHIVLLLAALTLLPTLAQAAMIGAGPGSGPRSVVIADLNEDGWSDMVWGNYQDSTVCVALGRGNGRFQPRVAYACGSITYGIAVADLNGDSHLDVVDCAASINKIQIRFGVGDGTLGPRTDYAVNQAMNVVARDVNEDGWPDLVIATQSAPFMKILRATGFGTFGALSEYAGASGIDLAVGDLNNDGDLDIVMGNASSNGVNVYLSSGSPGTYGAPVTYSTQGGGTSVVLDDFNHDGVLDVAVPNSGFKCLNIRLGNGDGTLAPNTVYPLDGEAFSGVSGDFNGDGNPDIAVSVNGTNEVSVFLGTGSGTFLPKVDYPCGMNPLRIAAGQIDIDGTVDLAIAAWGQNSISTLPGNGDGTFQVPGGPVYVWAPQTGSAFDPNAWLPARNSSSTSDVLVFNRGGAINVNSVPPATIGQLVFSGGTQATFSGFLGPATLTVAGGPGEDAVVEEGSAAVLSSVAGPVTVNIGTGAHSTIYGDVEIRSGSSKFQAIDPGGILFQSPGRLIVGPGSSTTPLGNGTGASGMNSVFFNFGSRYIAQTPVAVFGSSFPNHVVTFNGGSRFRQEAAFNPDVSGRRYADYEYTVPGGSSAFVGSSPLILDSLIVGEGTLSVEIDNSVSIQGNIVLGPCGGASALRFVPPSPRTYHLEGAAPQAIRGEGSCSLSRIYASANVTWDINNPGGVFFNKPWRTVSNFNFTHGNILLAQNFTLTADSSSTFTGASQSTGWVRPFLTRRASADGPLRLDVGDDTHYLPMDLVVHGLTVPGYFIAGTFPFDHQELWAAQLDPSHLVHRTWTLTASNTAINTQDPTFFGNVDATFAFLPSEIDPGSDTNQFVVRQDRPAFAQWLATTTGAQTATSTQALAIACALLKTHTNFSVGQPITPSLAVFNAASPEGNGPPAPLQIQAAGSLSFRVRLSQAAIVPVSVDYQTTDGTATVADGDYTPTSGTLTFAAGDTALDIVVPFGVDSTPEHNETFGITLSNPSNATIDTPSATGTITDDDDLTAPTAQVVYPNGGEVIHQGQQVTLQWTASDNFVVNGVDILLVNGAIVTTLASNYPNTGSYNWLSTGPASTKMKLRVVAHDDNHATIDNSDANWEISPYTIGVEDELPVAFALAAMSPNPSSAGSNRIAFSVPRDAQVRLTIHDVRGRTVAKLVDGTLPAGNHTRMWDSSSTPAGVYFVRFEAPGFHADRRLVLLR